MGRKKLKYFLTLHVLLRLFGEDRVLSVGVEQQCQQGFQLLQRWVLGPTQIWNKNRLLEKNYRASIMGCGEEEVETLSPIIIHVPLRGSNLFFQNYSWCVLKRVIYKQIPKNKGQKINKHILCEIRYVTK